LRRISKGIRSGAFPADGTVAGDVLMIVRFPGQWEGAATASETA
jgi:hypothetical protein